MFVINGESVTPTDVKGPMVQGQVFPLLNGYVASVEAETISIGYAG
jgi:hypothetical protein